MNKELKKQIFITFIIAVVLVGILYTISLFIPTYVYEEQVKDENYSPALEKCSALCILNEEDINFESGACISEDYNKTYYGYSCDITGGVSCDNNLVIELNSKCKEK